MQRSWLKKKVDVCQIIVNVRNTERSNESKSNWTSTSDIGCQNETRVDGSALFCNLQNWPLASFQYIIRNYFLETVIREPNVSLAVVSDQHGMRTLLGIPPVFLDLTLD